MTRRSASRPAIDELRFAIRVTFFVSDTGLGADLLRLDEWLPVHVGNDRFAVHSATYRGGSAVAPPLGDTSDCGQVAGAFPQLLQVITDKP